MRRCFLSCTLALTRSITAATRASCVIIGVASYLEIPDASRAMLLGAGPFRRGTKQCLSYGNPYDKRPWPFCFFSSAPENGTAFRFRFSIPGNGPACKGFWGYLPKKLGCGCLPGTIRTGKGSGRVYFDIVQLGHLRGCMVRKLRCTGGLPIPFWLLPYHLSGLFSCETSLDFFRAGDLVSKRVTAIWTIYGMSMTGMAR